MEQPASWKKKHRELTTMGKVKDTIEESEQDRNRRLVAAIAAATLGLCTIYNRCA